MSSDWKWHEAHEKECTVVPSVRAIAVYTNQAGDIVVRQEGTGYGDDPDDSFVVVPRTMVAAVVKAIRAEVAKPFDPTEE